MSCNFSSSTHVNFTRVSITEAMYERSHVNVKVARGSIFTSTRDIPQFASILLRAENLLYERTHGKITRQWKSTLCRVFFTAFARLIIAFFFQLLKRYFNL